jgi:hypothetical protein
VTVSSIAHQLPSHAGLPYVHRKGEPGQVDEAPVAMIVLDDPHGFDADIADKLETIHQDQERLRSLGPRLSDSKTSQEFKAACEKAKQTTTCLGRHSSGILRNAQQDIERCEVA